LHDRSLHFDVRVAPCTDLRVFAEVFIAHIVSANESDAPVYDDDLAMVTKIDLESIRFALARVEAADVHPGRTQFIDVTSRQIVAADLVIKHVTAHARARLFHENVFQTSPQVVVVDDIKLHENVVPRFRDALEDGAEGRVAVDQQLRVIPMRGGKFRQFLEQCRTRRLRLGRRTHRQEIAGELAFCVAQLRFRLATQNNISLEARAPKNPIRRHGDIWKGIQRHRPGDCPLRRSHVENGADRSERAQKVPEQKKRVCVVSCDACAARATAHQRAAIARSIYRGEQ
jgi:hypothetical protein